MRQQRLAAALTCLGSTMLCLGVAGAIRDYSDLPASQLTVETLLTMMRHASAFEGLAICFTAGAVAWLVQAMVASDGMVRLRV